MNFCYQWSIFIFIPDQSSGLRGSCVRRQRTVRVESWSDLNGDEVGGEVGFIRVCTEV